MWLNGLKTSLGLFDNISLTNFFTVVENGGTKHKYEIDIN
jgi:hypothetical protein